MDIHNSNARSHSSKELHLLEDKLGGLGFKAKEAQVYLALLEFGTQPAAVIAKKVGHPKPTVLFILDRLVERQFVRKSHKGRTQYFYADPADMAEAFEEEMAQRSKVLEETLPLLKDFKNPFNSPPKVSFFEGIEGCQKAYRMMIESESQEAYEFGMHTDLEKMGKDFMARFINDRAGAGVFLHDICVDNEVHRRYKKIDAEQMRNQTLYDPKMGDLHSSIAVFDNKVLLLNLHQDAFAILIENKEVAETLKTIHRLAEEGTKGAQ
jgi:predicted transcriptional regulator